MANNKISEDVELAENLKNDIEVVAQKAINKATRKWNRIVIFFGLTFLLVMVLLIAVGVFCIANIANTFYDLSSAISDGQAPVMTIERNGLLSADYLAAVIPILLALGGSFIAFLGMNRLKMFDERIDRTRSEMLKEVESKVKSEVSLDREAFSNQILQGIRDEQIKFKDSVDGAEKALSAQKEKCIEEITEAFRNFDQKYSWLESTIKNKEADLDFHTIDDAHKLVERLRSSKPDGYISIVKKIIDRVCNSDDMSGGSDDYHNLAAELARGSMYNEACKVLKKGEQIFKTDVDILSSIIEYSTKGGLEYAADAVKNLESMNHRVWTWRCYEFICDYYRSIGELDKANDLCDEFMEVIPNDEHGYRSKSEVLLLLYPGQKGIDESVKVLETALEKNINCPQCANALSEYYLSIGQYADALIAANRAVTELAQQQPHVPAAIVFYNRASVQDRMFMQGLKNGAAEQSWADAAYKDYRIALELSLESLIPVIAGQAKMRRHILKDYISEECAKAEAAEILSKLQHSFFEDNEDEIE